VKQLKLIRKRLRRQRIAGRARELAESARVTCPNQPEARTESFVSPGIVRAWRSPPTRETPELLTDQPSQRATLHSWSGVVSAHFTTVLLTLTLLGSNVVAQKNVQPISVNTPEHFRGADSGVSGH
jgi:hypothetical protein